MRIGELAEASGVSARSLRYYEGQGLIRSEPCLEASPEERTGVMETLLAREVRRLETKRRDVERELEVLQAIRGETALPGRGPVSPPSAPGPGRRAASAGRA